MLRRVLASSLQRTLINHRPYSAAYDGDSKTTVSILHQDRPELLIIKGYTDFGFRLSNGSLVVGPIVMLPRTVLHWNVGKVQDVNVDSVTLFAKLVPKPDIVVIGYGSRGNIRLPPDMQKFFAKEKIGVEFLSTGDAISTFNYLNADGRLVAGAFLPLRDPKSDTEFYAQVEEKKRKLLEGR